MKFSDQVLAFPVGLLAFNVYSFIFSRLGDFRTFEANYVDALMAIGYILGLGFFVFACFYSIVVLAHQRLYFTMFQNIIIPNIVFWSSMIEFDNTYILTSYFFMSVSIIHSLHTSDLRFKHPIGWKAIIFMLLIFGIFLTVVIIERLKDNMPPWVAAFMIVFSVFQPIYHDSAKSCFPKETNLDTWTGDRLEISLE